MNISRKRQILTIYIILTLATLAVYWQAALYDFVNLDDPVYVTENSHVKSGITPDGFYWAFSTVHAEFWHPLTWISLMFDYQIYGLKAGGYHLTNIILHILSALLLFWLFNRMTGAIWRSAFIAALFALHPLHVESVAWIAERKDTLSAFFWMLTLCLYVYYTEKPVKLRYLLLLLCFTCGLMSKSMVVTLPIVMILFDYWPLDRLQKQKAGALLSDAVIASNDRRRRKTKRKKGMQRNNISTPPVQEISEAKLAGIIPLWQLREKVPLFILSAVFAIVTFYAQYRPSYKSFPSASLIANSLVSYMTYLEKTFWPHDLAVFYPFSDQLPFWQVWGSALLLLLISAAVIVTAKRLPYLFVGWFWYILTLIPVIGIVNKVGNQAMADRYTYLTATGIGIMLVWGIPSLIKTEALRKKILFPASVIFLVILSFLTWKQCGYWENDFTLYEHALKVTENNDLAHYNLGNALKNQGKMEEALYEFRETVRIRPSSADAHNNIGIILEMYLKKYNEAIYHYQQALQVDPQNPGIHFNYGMALTKKGNIEEAIEHFRRAVYLNPNYEAARQALKMAQEIKQWQNR